MVVHNWLGTALFIIPYSWVYNGLHAVAKREQGVKVKKFIGSYCNCIYIYIGSILWDVDMMLICFNGFTVGGFSEFKGAYVCI
jgi:hypothetical protein